MPVEKAFQVGGQTDFALWNPKTVNWSVSLSNVTLYSYDTLGNLLCVEQHGNVTGAGCGPSPGNDATVRGGCGDYLRFERLLNQSGLL